MLDHHPELANVKGAPYTGGDYYLYAIEFSNGVLKVGITGKPRQRMIDHKACARKHGLRLARLHVSDQIARDYGAEYDLIGRVARIANAFAGRREFFVDTTFPVVRQLCDQVTAWHINAARDSAARERRQRSPKD